VKDTVRMIVFVLILGAVWTSLLVMVDKKTAPIIKAYKEEMVRKSVLETLDISCEGRDVAEVFEQNVEKVKIGEKTIFKSKAGRIVFEIEGSGVQGPISGVLALEKDLTTVKGIKIVDNVETPGLGDRVFEKETLDRFKEKRFDPKLLIVGEGKAKKVYEVDGITSATLTCKAFQKILNREREAHVKAIRGDDK
jgi:Na+-translocating ferredoxin:NAD+ oxidoreductase RnfG subunit